MAIKYEGLWSRWRQSGDKEARDQLIEEYLWLVRYVAGRLMVGLPPQYEQVDLEGHGCFGLLDAVDRYDPGRGVRFETYAIPWVKGACLEGIRALQWAPALRKRVRQMEKAQQELYGVLGREPSSDELAEALRLSPAQLEQRIAESGCLAVLSLEEMIGADDGSLLRDLIADPRSPDPVQELELADRRELLARAVDLLSDQEKLVLSLYYQDGLTGREIAEVMHLSAARISQIHSRAILRLRGKLSRMKSVLVC